MVDTLEIRKIENWIGLVSTSLIFIMTIITFFTVGCCKANKFLINALSNMCAVSVATILLNMSKLNFIEYLYTDPHTEPTAG